MQLNLGENMLCGLNPYTGGGTYDATGITALAEALRANASLTSVDLSSNGLGPAGVKALVDGGAFTGSLTSLR